MSLQASVIISFEELRALNHLVRLGVEQAERIQGDAQAAAVGVHKRVANQFIAGCKSALWQELSSLRPGDHLRELYWADAWEINDEDLLQAPPFADVPDFDKDDELLELINAARSKRGQEPLSPQDIN